MPVTPTYPGVYIEELPSGVRTLIGVGTSITAFVGRALRGPVNEPVNVFSFGDFERLFGGLWVDSTMSYAVRQYFLNGGAQAIIVRVNNGGTKGVLTLPASSGNLVLTAVSEGSWSDALTARASVINANASSFHLTIRERSLPNDATAPIVKEEVFYNVNLDSTSPRFVTKVVENESSLVRVTTLPGSVPTETGATDIKSDQAGTDGSDISATQVEGVAASKTGIYALEKADLFNMLVIPPYTRATDGSGDIAKATWDKARVYCTSRRAMLIVDPPMTWDSYDDLTDTTINGVVTRDKNALLYFPQVYISDPLKGNQNHLFAPGGTIAGVIARTDSERGVWKAAAGIDARLVGVNNLRVKLTDGEQGTLNPLGVNVLRTLPAAGNVVWGARTLDGADRLASEWKYAPVRRLALYMEESLYRGTQWVVFEPNDESLWAQIRLNVGAFMHQLFRQGAFQGAKPSESYFVKCDKETTTQNDINQGVVNIIVGFAPLKPAEFVIIKLQQMAGQIAV